MLGKYCAQFLLTLIAQVQGYSLARVSQCSRMEKGRHHQDDPQNPSYQHQHSFPLDRSVARFSQVQVYGRHT